MLEKVKFSCNHCNGKEYLYLDFIEHLKSVN